MSSTSERGGSMPVRTSFDPVIAKKIIKSVPLFASFSDQDLSLLLEKTNVYSCQKNETIFLADDQNNLMYIIVKGRVKVVEITADGTERVMAFRQRGDYFGDMGLLDGKTDFATVIAMEPSKVLLITKRVFDEFFLDNKKALREVIAVLCHRLRESWAFNGIIGMGDAESKIRATLNRYGETLGVRDTYGVIINSTFTHQSIADHILVTRETVTRILGRMKEQQEIEMIGRRIKLLPPFFAKNA